MKNSFFIVALLFFASFFVANPYVWGHTDITPQDAKSLIDTNTDLIVVDVREEDSEYCNEDPTSSVPPGHIPGALNYPWSSGVLQERYTELPIDGEILVVCRSGNRSNQAAEFLDSKGFMQIYDMTEGMSAWEWDTVGCVDSDEDGINDDLDNCPNNDKPDQADIDDDDIGDVCDTCPYDSENDTDNDDVCGDVDNCPNDYNPNQEDSDQNGLGDACDSNPKPCFLEEVYGDNSVEAKQLRDFRDNVLSQTPPGHEIKKLYYELSPALVKAMKGDEMFKGKVKKMIDEILPLIGVEAK